MNLALNLSRRAPTDLLDKRKVPLPPVPLTRLTICSCPSINAFDTPSVVGRPPNISSIKLGALSMLITRSAVVAMATRALRAVSRRGIITRLRPTEPARTATASSVFSKNALAEVELVIWFF